MPIRLITGLPGNGKTLLMVADLEEQARLAERPLFQCGIDGLKPGLAERFDDARAWNAIDPNAIGECTCGKRAPHAHVIPNGALVYVDEAWKWFGHLHDARGQQTPLGVLDLAEHRHRGIDFVWTSQSPTQIYPFARALIAEHSHIVRRFGTHMATIYSWSELNDDVKSRTMRDAAISRTWKFPPKSFESYKSATQHTIKRKIPFRLFMIPAAVLAVIVAGFLAYSSLRPETVAAASTAPGAASPGSPGVPPTANTGSASSKVKYPTAESYYAAHTPRIASMPWTAPIYDDREVTAEPMLLCVESGGDMPTCHCYNEQGTPYQSSPPITPQQCDLFAHHGQPYNPHRRVTMPAQYQGENRTASTPVEPTHAASSGSAVKFAAIPHYGQIHTEQPAPDIQPSDL